MVNDRRAFRIVYLALSGLFLLALAITTAATGSEFDKMTAPDKRLHAAGGLAIGVISSAFVQATAPDSVPGWEKRLAALLPVVLIGVGKEAIYDRAHRDRHTPEVRDALATILGGAVAVEITFRF